MFVNRWFVSELNIYEKLRMSYEQLQLAEGDPTWLEFDGEDLP